MNTILIAFALQRGWMPKRWTGSCTFRRLRYGRIQPVSVT